MPDHLALLQWHEPIEVTRWRWQQVTLPFCKKVFFHLAKLMLPASFPVLVVAIVWMPELLFPALAALLFVLCIPLESVLPLWFARNSPVVYEINDQGCQQGKQLYKWADILNYDLDDHELVSGVTTLTLYSQTEPERVDEIECYFDPNEVSESQLREWIEAHLGK